MVLYPEYISSTGCVNKEVMLLPFVLALLCSSSWAMFRAQFPNTDSFAKGYGDAGNPLFVTPYLEKGDVQTARKLARVGSLGNTSVESYSGFFTVNKTYNSNMFFWFFPSESHWLEDPVLLWLQGGPGGSSLFGLFVENGPFTIDRKLNVLRKEYSWTQKYSMLYIDNPVGTGFSFTDQDAGYATNETDVAENLYRALVQFYMMFPELQKLDLYLTGESYAGKYIPALAHRIHTEEHPKQVLLRGLAIGDGFTDPPTMVTAYADFMYQTGLLDEKQRDYFQAQVHIISYLIKQGQYAKAFQVWQALDEHSSCFLGDLDWYNYLRSKAWDLLMNGDQTKVPSYYQNATGCSNYYNFLLCKSPTNFSYYNDFLQQTSVRAAIHVGNLTYNSGDAVEKHLINDILQSATPWLAEAMNYYKVMLYSGQLDVIVAAPLTENMLWQLDWLYADEYRAAERKVWRIHEHGDVAGYVRQVHDFYQVIVKGGGHILPYDQPARSFDMIDRFITGMPFA